MTEVKQGDKLVFTVVAGRRDVNALMADFDLRPDYKVFAKTFDVEVTVDGTRTLEQIFTGMRNQLMEHMLLASLTYQGLPQLRYVNPQFREISDGENVRYILQQRAKSGKKKQSAKGR